MWLFSKLIAMIVNRTHVIDATFQILSYLWIKFCTIAPDHGFPLIVEYISSVFAKSFKRSAVSTNVILFWPLGLRRSPLICPRIAFRFSGWSFQHLHPSHFSPALRWPSRASLNFFPTGFFKLAEELDIIFGVARSVIDNDSDWNEFFFPQPVVNEKAPMQVTRIPSHAIHNDTDWVAKKT